MVVRDSMLGVGRRGAEAGLARGHETQEERALTSEHQQWGWHKANTLTTALRNVEGHVENGHIPSEVIRGTLIPN